MGDQGRCRLRVQRKRDIKAEPARTLTHRAQAVAPLQRAATKDACEHQAAGVSAVACLCPFSHGR